MYGVGGCERCGRFDSTLRATSFLYTISLLVVTFRRGAGGVYCGSCRKKEGLKWTLLSSVMGWWGFPWGPIYTLQAIGRNSGGGYQDPEINAHLLQVVAQELIEDSDTQGAVEALEASLRLRDDGDARQALWSIQGEPATLAGSSPVAAVSSARSEAVPSSRFGPGALVRTRLGNASLYARPEESGAPVATLEDETAVVLRAQARWLEVQVPGGRSGWVVEGAVELAGS